MISKNKRFIFQIRYDERRIGNRSHEIETLLPSEGSKAQKKEEEYRKRVQPFIEKPKET